MRFSDAPFVQNNWKPHWRQEKSHRKNAGFHYAKRIRRMLRLAKQYGVVQNGDRVLELGTGWCHWEALTLRLFFDIEAVLFDVWDNRQLASLKNYLSQLGELLKSGDRLGLSPAELNRAESLITKILKVGSFEELYGLLGFSVCG